MIGLAILWPGVASSRTAADLIVAAALLVTGLTFMLVPPVVAWAWHPRIAGLAASTAGILLGVALTYFTVGPYVLGGMMLIALVVGLYAVTAPRFPTVHARSSRGRN